MSEWWKGTADSVADGSGFLAQDASNGVPQEARSPEAAKPLSHPYGVVIAVGNQKGGVGKTTTTVHLASALGLRGHKCLIIDLDPAAGATKHLGLSGDEYLGSLELLTHKESVTSLAVGEGMPTGVHLIPSRPQLSELDTLLSRFMDRMSILEEPLNEARGIYDFIFVDTAPIAAATTTVAAYASSDWFLLSAFAHPLSMGGLSEAFRDIGDVRRYRNPKLEVLGVVFTNVDTRAKKLRARIEDVIDETLPDRRFHTCISQAVVIPECSGKGIVLFQLPKHHRIKVARQYIDLSKEVEHRVLNRDAFLAGSLSAQRCA